MTGDDDRGGSHRRTQLFHMGSSQIAASVQPDLLLGQIGLQHLGDGPGQELPVVADHHRAGPQAVDKALQPVEPVEVEVVGRLVEQEQVIAAEQQLEQVQRPGERGTCASNSLIRVRT
ncbi:hypothetical protein AB0F17_54085 [Nonomuraea sp. NPDC026600]|uniref:hypothetical protein n=1 Tax=Nonomuraea sp. NPDC026600 TaxID=3155363 RepID=UPI003407D8C6